MQEVKNFPKFSIFWRKFPLLGRLFKIHNIFLHGFDKNDIVNSWISIIYNIKISSKPCRKKLWILDNLSNREILNNIPFTFVNHDLRKISSDKVTPKWLIIKIFRCHLSLSLSPQILLRQDRLRFGNKNKNPLAFYFVLRSPCTIFRLGYPVR